MRRTTLPSAEGLTGDAGEPLRVLLVEDSEDDAVVLLRELRRGGYLLDARRVEERDPMREALASGTWDLILSDWTMPRFSALDALDVLKETGLDVPFILVSGTIGEERVVHALRAGALDFVAKNKLSRLIPAIRRELREARDRTAHRQAGRELRVSEARYRVLFEGSPSPTWVVDADSQRILAVNEAATRLYGYGREEFLRLSFSDLRAPEDALAGDGSAAGGASPDERIRLHRKKDGSVISVKVRTQDFAVEGSRGRFVVVNDVTTLRKTEDQLRQSQKMDAVGRLAGGVAHDFNNVLSVILSYGEMLYGDAQPGDPMQEGLLEIVKAGKRAADLTRQLLMFSRQQVIAPRVIDLNEVLVGMDKMLQRILGADVHLVSSPATAIGRVRVDPSSMEQVIMNLVVNARDAMPRGGILTIETRNVALDDAFAQGHLGVKPGPYVMLAVTDTGTGMDKATLAHIFEPFFTTKAAGKGTGLGLSTVFGIVQQSGGSIWVYSEPGTGTTFKIYLPRVDEEIDSAKTVIPPDTLRGTETILLVEDDDQVRTVARGILRKCGYRVIEARNAGEALLHAERGKETIHLLLTDVVMPQMSGPELAERLIRVRPEMKVICMSGYTDDSIVRHGVIDARMPYIQKPITPQSLTTKVREVLDAR